MSGLLLDGLDLQDEAGGYLFEVLSGGPDDIAESVGEDDEVPEATGLSPGTWTAKRRHVKLHGLVFGDGLTLQQVRESFRARMDALAAKMSAADLHTIVAHPPNFGLSAGQTDTLSNVRPQRIVGPTAVGDVSREIRLELVCIDSPPEWVVA